MVSTANSRRVLLLVLMFPLSAAAWDWKFVPTLSATERYSDNISLSATDPESSFLTEIRPGFNLSSKGARGRVSVDYGLQTLLYSHDGDANTTNSQLSANLYSELLEDSLFIDAKANIGQQSGNLTAPTGSGNYNTTGNLVETRSASITPSWRARIGNKARIDARWQVSYTDSDSATYSGSTNNSFNLNITSGSEFNRFPWSLGYRLDHSDGGTEGNRNDSLNGSLSYVYSRKMRYTLTVGRDGNNGDSEGFDEVRGAYWNLGIQWAPTSRTNLRATAGHRYNGNSYGLDFTHRSRKTTWALRYSEALSDQLGQLSGLAAFDFYLCGESLVVVLAGAPSPDPATCGATPILPAVYVPVTVLFNDTSLNKTWAGSASYKTGKSTFTASLSKSRRQLLTEGGGDDQYSISGSWAFRLNPRLSSSLTLTSSHARSDYRDQNGASESDDWTLSWLLTRRFTQKTSGVLEVRRLERESGSTTGGYSENSVSARLNMKF